MEDNLPLLPNKDGTLCADVRPILREVFRDVDNLAACKLFDDKADKEHDVDSVLPSKETEWVNNISSEYAKLQEQEIKLQREHAKRHARNIPSNQYKLHSPTSSEQTSERETLLRRRDLKPSLQQNANCNESLWVKNILNRSSDDVTAKVIAEKTDLPTALNVSNCLFDEGSSQSMSIGEIIPRPLPPTPVVPSPPAAPNYILSIPTKFDFVNFKVGQLHTQSLRLVNVSKFEVRLSVRPPSRKELDVELCSRFAVTSGSAAELKIHFRPKDVRHLKDNLDVSVSNGQKLCIPISCYMEPPLLEILINNDKSSATSFSKSIETINDIIDLGTKLLGDIHRAEFLLRCSAKHASFFLISEDAWIDYTIEYKTYQSGKEKSYGIEVDSFFIAPVMWCGGGDVKGLAVCRALNTGLQTAALRIISSTAISRPLHLIADTIMFTPKHFTVQAHEKDYDICSEDDPSCEYYVNLGVAFPRRALSATINVSNHSPISYNYYWKSRTWGVCCCWNSSENLLDEENDSDLCPGARDAKLKSKMGEKTNGYNEKFEEVVLDEPAGCMKPHSNVDVTVRVPNAGSELGVQRSVIMLILKDIPEESITEEYKCLIVNTADIANEKISEGSPCSQERSRQVCEVLCFQVEVWWEVVPVRFILDPPAIRLPHSRRIKCVTPHIRATQLYGVSNVQANWELLGHPPSPATLTPGQPTITKFVIPLLNDRSPHTDFISLVSEGNEWVTSASINQHCDTRHPSLSPPFVWLGAVVPGATLAACLTVTNDTYEDIDWCATVYRYCGERGVAEACETQPPCVTCHSRLCTCSILTPTSGTLKHSQSEKLTYRVCAPDSDGCVATLVRVRRTDVATGSSMESRATLIAYRVLAPRVVLRVLPCYGDKRGACKGCSLDPGDGVVLRPQAALVMGERTCYRLQIANVAPLPTKVVWEPAIEGEDVLEVSFQLNEFKVDSYSKIEMMVVLEAKQVTDRRLFLRRANVAHTKKPLYLVIDAAVSGVEVIVEFPIEDQETLSFASFKLMQKGNKADECVQPRSDEEIFAEYDLKSYKQRENICDCDEDVFITPEKHSKPLEDIDGSCHRVEILDSGEPPRGACKCTLASVPPRPEQDEPLCLQFRQLPLRTVQSRTVILRNVSRLDTRWTASVRRWPRRHDRTIDKDQWSCGVSSAGIALEYWPASGVLLAGSRAELHVRVYCDCWGIYRDQLLLQLESLEPLIVDVYVEAVGSPLEFPLQPCEGGALPTVWLSDTDPDRSLVVRNTSRADLLLHAFVARENEYPQDELPFRLYVRLFDVPRPVCPCVTSDSENSSVADETDTGVELFLTDDHGAQDDAFFQVEPLECLIAAGERTTFKLRLLPQQEPAPDTVLILRPTPVNDSGPGWCRPPPATRLALVRHAWRSAVLQASRSSLSISLCALDLPYNDVLRIRKRFQLRNVGDAHLQLSALTEAPWSVHRATQICAARCTADTGERSQGDSLKVSLAPRSSTEMVVEVSVRTNEVWPEVGSVYEPRSVTRSELCFRDVDDVVLLRVPLTLAVEFPRLRVRPEHTRCYAARSGGAIRACLCITHSSPTATIHVLASCSGDEAARVWPQHFALPPRTTARIDVVFTPRWQPGDSEASVCVCVRATGAARWCAASAHVTGHVTGHVPRCTERTDDTRLTPNSIED